jgi:hypothetical protein
MRLEWDDRNAIFGVDRGVLYPKNAPGVSWGGLISVEESEEDGGFYISYVDGQKFMREKASNGFSAKVESLSPPIKIDKSYSYGFSYRTEDDLHLIYNAQFQALSHTFSTLNETTPELKFGWDVSTKPALVERMHPTSHLIVNLKDAYPGAIAALEDVLYGTDVTTPRLPTFLEILDIFEPWSMFTVVDNGDGSWSAIGPASMVNLLDANTFQINSPSLTWLDANTYEVSSW